MAEDNERVKSFSLADIRVLIAQLDDQLHGYFHAGGHDHPDGDFITRFVALLAWMQVRQWVVFSPHDNKMIKELAEKIGCKLIEQAKAAGVTGAPIEEKRIVFGDMVHNPNDKKGMN